MSILCGLTGLVHLSMLADRPVSRGDEPEGAAL